MSHLSTDYDERKGLPLWTFLMEYFPLAWLALVRISVAGDKQHLNNSEPGKMRWARDKSTDQLNTAMRHQFDYGTGCKYDVDGHPHLGKAIWRLAAQLEIDEERRLGLICETCFAEGKPLRRESCPHAPVITTRTRCTAKLKYNYLQCELTDGHPGEHKTLSRPPRICRDCGADLDEGRHAPGCLSAEANRQHW